MDYSENKKQRRIEKKYERKVNQALEEYKDRPFKEFWEYCEELKQEMKQELIRVGVISEDK